MESILETKAATILELAVTFEDGTWAARLYDLLKPHVAQLVVYNPRKKLKANWQDLIKKSSPKRSRRKAGRNERRETAESWNEKVGSPSSKSKT